MPIVTGDIANSFIVGFILAIACKAYVAAVIIGIFVEFFYFYWKLVKRLIFN